MMPTASRLTSTTAVRAQITAHEYETIARFWREGPAGLNPAVSGMADKEQLHVAVVIPPFRRGSGGHTIIFQLVHHLERMGHTCSLWHHDPFAQQGEWPGVLRHSIIEDFVPVNAAMHRGFDDWYGADVVLATGWQTVYPALLLPEVRARAYLINDHENEFYPTSVESYWAAQTYQLGLHGIAGSPWLHDLYETRYGGTADWFQYGVDHKIYHPRTGERRGDTVVFYARDVTQRRAVALGILALHELHRRRPDTRIVLFGDPLPMRAPFPYEHLGVASPGELATVFAKARVGLCLSMTNYSLMPQEMLACGLPCVDLGGASTESVFGRDGPVALADFDADDLAGTLERLLEDDEQWQQRSTAGLAFVADSTWDRATVQVEEGLRRALREQEHGRTDPVGAWRRAKADDPRELVRSHRGWSRSVPCAPLLATPVTDLLYERLDAEAIKDVRRALPPDLAAHYELSEGSYRRTLTLAFGVYLGVDSLLASSGLSAVEPPDAVHTMSRGPFAAGGGYWYSDFVVESLETAGIPWSTVRSGLDFGCSSGRVVRVLQTAYPEISWKGCDPNEPAIAWASEVLAGIDFAVSPQEPPLPYADSSLDLAFAISIWSHYSEPAARRWLDEMHRVLRPGGALLLTTHGFHSLAYYAERGLRPQRQLAEIRDALYTSGHWFENEFGEHGDHGVVSADWGTAFMSQEWLLDAIRGSWRLADFRGGVLEGNQDGYLLVPMAADDAC